MPEEKLQYFVGLDIGTTAVRSVVGELSSEGPRPKIIAATSAENTGMRKGNVAHVEEVAQATVVNPREQLDALARIRNWRIVRWSVDGVST